MRFKLGRQMLVPAGLLLTMPSCGTKTEENAAFPKKLDELTTDEFLSTEDKTSDTLWTSILTALKTNAIDVSSQANVVTSLGKPSLSQYITDPTTAAGFAASRGVTVASDYASQKCAEVYTVAGNKILVDLDPGGAYNTAYPAATQITSGGFKVVGGVPTSLALPIKVYLLKYKLGADTSYRMALLSVPTTAPSAATGAVAADTTGGTYGYPIAVYAHAGAGGLAYGEVASALGDLQMNHIVLAPVFPGEPLCVAYDTGTTTCTKTNIATGGEAVGTFNPYVTDVPDFLGAYQCLQDNIKYTQFDTAVASPYQTTYKDTTFAVVNKSGTATGTLNLNALVARISPVLKATTDAANTSYLPSAAGANGATAQTAAIAAITSLTKLGVVAQRPLVFPIGLGRGANVVNLALSRAGGLNSVISSTNTALATLQSALTTAGATPMFFSCAATLSPQATFTAGKNKIFLDYWVKGKTGFFTKATAEKLDLVPGFAKIKANIAAIRDSTTMTEAAKATAIADYIKAIDGTLNLASEHGALQNWGKSFLSQYTAGTDAAKAAAIMKVAQGAGLVLHGTADVVASAGNSQLFTGVAKGVSASLEAASPQVVGGVRWLGLGIVPLALPITDNGHVADASFLTGKSVAYATSGIDTNLSDVTPYLDKTPAQIIAAWLGTSGSCRSAITATYTP